MLIKARFEKLGYVRLIGHLDLMKVFQRAIKRAGVKLKYSEGYNPAPKLSIGNPLPLGVESMMEFVEFETALDYDIEHMVIAINSQLPKGIRLTEVAETQQSVSISRKIRCSSYELFIPVQRVEPHSVERAVSLLLNSETFKVERQKRNKKTKRLETVQVEIRGLLISAEVFPMHENIRVTFMGLSSDGANLRSDLIVKAIEMLTESSIPMDEVRVIRTGQYGEACKELDLGD